MMDVQNSPIYQARKQQTAPVRRLSAPQLPTKAPNGRTAVPFSNGGGGGALVYRTTTTSSTGQRFAIGTMGSLSSKPFGLNLKIVRVDSPGTNQQRHRSSAAAPTVRQRNPEEAKSTQSETPASKPNHSVPEPKPIVPRAAETTEKKSENQESAASQKSVNSQKTENAIAKKPKSNRARKSIRKPIRRRKAQPKTPAISESALKAVRASVFSSEGCGARKGSPSPCWTQVVNGRISDGAHISAAELIDWNVSQVSEFVNLLPYCGQAVSQSFEEELIDGEAFLLLSQDDLIDRLHMKLGAAVKLFNVLQHIKHKTNRLH